MVLNAADLKTSLKDFHRAYIYIYIYIYNSLKVQKSQKIKQELKRWKKKSGEKNSADAANGRNTSTSSTHILKTSDRNEIEIW